MRLNLGCADWKLEGWENVDLPGLDLSVFPWPWKENSIDEILASHVLEHFDKRIGYEFLKECYRILKPGGVLHVAAPDMDKFIDCWRAGDFSPLGGYVWTSLNYLMGGDLSEPRPEWRHQYMYCFASLAWTLERAGFEQIELRNDPLEIDNPEYADFSLYVDAVK